MIEWWHRRRQARQRSQLRQRIVRGLGWAVILEDPDGARQALEVWHRLATARTTQDWNDVWSSYALFLRLRRLTDG